MPQNRYTLADGSKSSHTTESIVSTATGRFGDPREDSGDEVHFLKNK